MKWLVIVLIVLAVLLLVGLVWSMARRKQDQQRRTRADELRTEAAGSAQEHRDEEAKARAAEAEAARVRAEADQLEHRAQDQRSTSEVTRARHEDRIREADRLDPDVDHSADDYAPELDRHHDSSAGSDAQPGSRDDRQDRQDRHASDGRTDSLHERDALRENPRDSDEAYDEVTTDRPDDVRDPRDRPSGGSHRG